MAAGQMLRCRINNFTRENDLPHGTVVSLDDDVFHGRQHRHDQKKPNNVLFSTKQLQSRRLPDRHGSKWLLSPHGGAQNETEIQPI
jgi:hypothetical protein